MREIVMRVRCESVRMNARWYAVYGTRSILNQNTARLYGGKS